VTTFPEVEARNLLGTDVALPQAFEGERNVVLVAFRRNHQDLVDSWLPWLEQRAANDPQLRFYEIPMIGRIWAPARPFIDGGMASSIKDPVVLARTLTIYGDLGKVTGPLSIRDRSTISVFGLERDGSVVWRGTGAYSADLSAALAAALWPTAR
jgi:hypothetical protein